MKFVRMNYTISEDVQPLITPVRVPDFSILNYQFKLFSFGFVHWLNTDRCPLTKREKETLTELRLIGLNNQNRFEKMLSRSKNNELLGICKKLNNYYPKYQTWLWEQAKLGNAVILGHPKSARFIILNLPLEKLMLRDRIKKRIAEKFRSLHEMFLTYSPGKLRKLFPNESEFQELYQFACQYGFGELLRPNIRQM